MKRIYLDHAATTPLDERVFDAMRPYLSDTFGNASSVHWFGQQAKAALETSRETIARAIGAEPGEVLFTSGGTESDNFALRGVAYAARKNGKTHLITSAAEHHAVLETCEALAREGFEATFLPVNFHGMVDPDEVRQALKDSTFLVSIMHANNEVGTVSPIREIAEHAHARGVIVHTDAVQSLGKIPVNVRDLDIDLMTLSAHKMYGPKGIGALYVRRGIEIEPLLHGGGQEMGRRPGTENVALAVGCARALMLTVADMDVESARLKRLRDHLEARLRSTFPDIIVNGHPTACLPHILNVSFGNRRISLEGDMLLVNMDLRGFALASGSACTSGSIQPSHVLLAMGCDEQTAKATLRFSLGRSNTQEQINDAVDALREVVGQMTSATRRKDTPDP